jgi:hypothetical protein
LIGHWPFDEATGASTADASGFANAGTLSGGVGRVTGRLGSGLAFDGIDGSVAIEEQTTVLDVAASSFSYSMWVYVESNAGLYDSPWWRGGSSTFYPGYDIELGSHPWTAQLSDGSSVVLGRFGPAVFNSWVLLTAVVDREQGTLLVYRDAMLMDTEPLIVTSLATTRSAMIGGELDGQARFQGMIDDVRIYGRALDGDEVEALFRMQ